MKTEAISRDSHASKSPWIASHPDPIDRRPTYHYPRKILPEWIHKFLQVPWSLSTPASAAERGLLQPKLPRSEGPGVPRSSQIRNMQIGLCKRVDPSSRSNKLVEQTSQRHEIGPPKFPKAKD
jgi:hypothetical protein